MCVVGGGGGGWVFGPLVTTMNILKSVTCSCTVRTGVVLVTSSSEVNSSHASMALDNSLSTCFMSKDVSE